MFKITTKFFLENHYIAAFNEKNQYLEGVK